MKLCVVESPYAGDIERNTEFARNVCRALVWEGWNPYASHLFFTQFLDEHNPLERKIGIELGIEWTFLAHTAFFCTREDEEWSPGMQQAFKSHKHRKVRCVKRTYSQDGVLLYEEKL